MKSEMAEVLEGLKRLEIDTRLEFLDWLLQGIDTEDLNSEDEE